MGAWAPILIVPLVTPVVVEVPGGPPPLASSSCVSDPPAPDAASVPSATSPPPPPPPAAVIPPRSPLPRSAAEPITLPSAPTIWPCSLIVAPAGSTPPASLFTPGFCPHAAANIARTTNIHAKRDLIVIAPFSSSFVEIGRTDCERSVSKGREIRLRIDSPFESSYLSRASATRDRAEQLEWLRAHHSGGCSGR